MPAYLLLAAVVMFACVLLNKITSKLGIPMLLAFILLGMFFGSDGVVKIPFEDYAFAEKICSVALIFIMFYGGFGTSWKAAKPVAGKAVVLSTLGVVLTSALTGLFCRLALQIGWLESFLIGSVIGSTDAASVFYILHSKRLNLRDNTASLLELESGSNDPCSYMLTCLVLSAMQGNVSAGQIGYMIFSQIVYGLVLGIGIAVLAIFILKRVHFAAAGFDMVFVVATAILAYALPTYVGGNGYLSAYIVGILLGNTDIRHKKTLVPFFDGVTGMMQMLIFFLLGLLSFPSRLPSVALPALLIALFLTFVARPIAVFALLSPFKSKIPQQLVVSWAGLRGAASIVFAIMAVMVVKTENDLFHIVFCIVLFSILLQGSLLSFLSKKLGMIDNEADVMKTFSDYSEESPVQFIQFPLPQEHQWAGQLVREIILPPATLLVMVKREGESIVPNGHTRLLAKDELVLSASAHTRMEGVRLTERIVDQALDGKCIAELNRPHHGLIIMIERRGKVIIPNGQTVLQEKDLLVIHHQDP